jgi:hypothetical protein
LGKIGDWEKSVRRGAHKIAEAISPDMMKAASRVHSPSASSAPPTISMIAAKHSSVNGPGGRRRGKSKQLRGPCFHEHQRDRDNDTTDAANVRRNVCGGFLDFIIECPCRTYMSFCGSPHVRRDNEIEVPPRISRCFEIARCAQQLWRDAPKVATETGGSMRDFSAA